MNRIRLHLTLLVLSATAGCSAFAPPDLTGRWTAKELSIQFEKDSRVTVVTRGGVSRGLYSLDTSRSPAKLVIKTRHESSGTDSVSLYTAEFVGREFLKLAEKQNIIDGEPRPRRREQFFLLERAETLADGATLPATSAEQPATSTAKR